jgi:hypothetical protein
VTFGGSPLTVWAALVVYSVLLGLAPYAVAIVVYCVNTADIFGGSRPGAPSNWNWRLVAPVVVGGLTPLGLASSTEIAGSERGLLLSGTAAAVVFGVLTLSVLRSDRAYFRVQLPVTVGQQALRWLPWRHVIVGVGIVILAYCATTNLVVSSG